MNPRASWDSAVRDFPAGDPFVSLIAPEFRAQGVSSHASNAGTGADALGVTPPTTVAFDALTDLFLGGSARTALGADSAAPGSAAVATASPTVERARSLSRPTREPGSASDAVAIELLVAGHLPVMASVWVQQYARDRAIGTGAPVALVDIRTGRAWVQILDPRGQFVPEAGASLAAALRAVKAVVRTWMIRVDEVDEGAVRAAAPCGTVTLLSGADQAATVGAYRALKRLAAAGARPELVSVAVMGADAADADHAVDRVAAAAKSFLGITVKGSGISPRVDASLRPVTAFAGPLPVGGSSAAIKLLAECLAPPTPFVQEDDDADDVVSTPVAAPAPAAASPLSQAKPAQQPPCTLEPSHAVAVTAKAPAAPLLADSTPDAPLHVLIAGLEAIPVRCPVAPGVKLASDAQGRLHLVSIDVANSTEPVAPHIERLLAAGAWAAENHELLRVAFPRLSGPDRGLASPPSPVLHLAVDQPKRVRHLLDTPVKLHVLASAGTGSRGWVARPLN